MRRWLILAAVCVPCMGVAQDDDRSYLTGLLEDSFSDGARQVVITGFQGALSSRASLTQMTIADADGVWLTLRDVALDWNRSALLAGQVQINALTAGEIVLDRLPVTGTGGPSPEATGFFLPELPVSVDIGEITAERIVLGDAVLGEPVVATLTASLSLSGGEGSAQVLLQRTDGRTEGQLQLNAAYANATGQLSINLAAVEGADGVAVRLLDVPGAPSAELTIEGAGPITDFTADVDLKTDEVSRLSGQVQLTGDGAGQNGFAADLKGDLAPLFLPQYAEFFGPEVSLTATGTRSSVGRLDLSEFNLSARALSVAGSLLLSADGLPEQFALQARLGLDGEPLLLPMSGAETRVVGAEIGLRFDSRNSDGWDGEAILTGLDRSGFKAERVELTGSGRIARPAAGPLVSASLRYAATGLAPDDPGVAAALGTELSGLLLAEWQSGSGVVRVSDLQINGQDYAAQIAGSIAGLEQAFALSGRVDAQMTDLSRLALLAGEPLAGRGDITLSGTGSPLSGAFDVQVTVAGTDLQTGVAELDGLLAGSSTIEAAVRRDETGTELVSSRLVATSLVVSAQGRLGSDDSDLTAEVNFSDLGVLGDAYAGALQGTARLTGAIEAAAVTLTATAQNLSVGQAQADALLTGVTGLTLQVQRAEAGLRIGQLTLRNPQLALTAAGTVAAEGSDITADLTVNDLSDLGNFGGSLTGKARFTGTADQGVVLLNATGEGLAVGQPQADRLLAGTSTVVARVRLADGAAVLEQADIRTPQVSVSATGTLAAAGSDVTAKVALTNLAAVGGGYAGALDGTARFIGTAQTGRLTINATGNGLAIGQRQADALLRGQSVLSADLLIENGSVAVERAELVNPQLSVQATGQLADTARTLDLNARLGNLALILPAFPGVLSVTGTAVQDAGGYDLNLQANGPGQIEASVNGRISPDFRTADLDIQGTAQAALANAFIEPRAVSGLLRFDLGLDGPLRVSSLSGPVSLSGGRVADPALNFALENVQAQATLGGGRVQVSSTAAVSSGGGLQVDGSVGLAAPFDADLAVAVQRVTLRDPDLYQTTANGAVTISGPLAGGAIIAGRVALAETELRIPSTGMVGAGDLPGLVHVDEPADVRQTRVRAGLIETRRGGRAGGGAFGLDLEISAPNQVFIRGRGLDAELGGQLTLSGTTAAIVPFGSFSLIRGRLDILGKRLELSEALLQLEGALVPFIRVVASTENDGIISSVEIEGPATAPVVSFTSQPDLPEEEVLAQLLFGQTLQNLSAFQAVQLAGAVATLAGRSGQGLVSRIRQDVGLDNLDIRTDANGAASLTAGKYLTENIYTEVTVDQEGKSQINLNLDISSSITVRGRAESDGTTGIGVFLEKDY